jgi:plasmid stabilization system protein ParE
MVDELIERIAARPRSYSAIFRRVRAARVHRFPFVAYYRVHANRIEVLAVLHGSRDPQVWKDRA